MQHGDSIWILIPTNQMYKYIFDVISKVWFKYWVLDNTRK